ncbi:hypothetical protein TWF102_009829 [Orbilia oligospora]|uniref:Uncharacterized protein n=1 Tax=Orbilia oligospora TaxID=2813651 RepID=A0A7C8N067_ORBOL|nr:hypothetical protein TWF102_009829 [Orbilia oligospora]
MPTQKRVLVPASQENILQSHVGVILITLCGVAGLLGTLGICTYGYVKFRRAKMVKLEKKLEHERIKASIVHLSKTRTDETSRRSKSSDDTLPKRPSSLGNDYGMIGFGNCRTSYLESIAGSSKGVLPGDVVLPENGASTARNIRDTSAVLTPPMTPDRCRLPTIQHWNLPEERSGLPEPLTIGNTTLMEVPIPPPLAIRKEEKELPSPPITRGRKVQRWEEVDPPLFGAVKRASMRRRARSKSEGIETSSLRRFGELEARRGNARAKKEKYKRGRSTDWSEMAVEVVEQDAMNLGHEGYRASIIEAYGKEEIDEGSEYGDEEGYLWKPLPKPPIESGWPVGRAEMP